MARIRPHLRSKWPDLRQTQPGLNQRSVCALGARSGDALHCQSSESKSLTHHFMEIVLRLPFQKNKSPEDKKMDPLAGVIFHDFTS